MLSCVKVGGLIAFTIRDIYLDSGTDNGMDYKPTLDKLVSDGVIEMVSHDRYIKYRGL